MIYQNNKRKSVTWDETPTMTDQSMAKDTDINVIVKSYTITGQVPGGKEPIYADFTEYPRDMREMMEMAKGLQQHMRDLPPQLRNLGPEQILALTPAQLQNILAPPQTEAKKEEQK